MSTCAVRLVVLSGSPQPVMAARGGSVILRGTGPFRNEAAADRQFAGL